MTKQCRRCSTVKPVSAFRAGTGQHGVRSQCRACEAEKMREYRKNPAVKARIVVSDLAYRTANPEKRRALDNKPEKREADRLARQTPRGRMLAVIQRHWQIARDHGCAVNDFSLRDWLDLLEEFDNACAYCQKRDEALEIEHMTPLSRGGIHHRDNVVPACRSCNSRKQTRTIFEFLEKPRLVAAS